MKTIAFNASPRKNGNTQILLEIILKDLKEKGHDTELIQIGGTLVTPCKACQACYKNKNQECVIKTDSFNLWFKKMLDADIILLGSPTYFANVTAEMKALLDRVGYVSRANNFSLKGKIGSAIVAARHAGAVHAFDSINHMFQISKFIVPASIYWNLGLGGDKGEVKDDDEGLENMHDLALVLDWLATCLKSGAPYPS